MMPRGARGGWQLGGGGRLPLNNDEATFEGGGVGSRTSSKWMRRSLLGKMEASGYGPSEPQFAAVIVVPPPPPPPTADGDGGEGGERRFPDTTANTVESIFCIMDGNRFFVIAVVMDGRRKGGATAMVGGSTSTTALQISRRGMRDVDTGKTAHRHGDRTHVHRRRDKGGEEEEEWWQRRCDDRPEQQDNERAARYEVTQRPASAVRGQEGGATKGREGNRGDENLRRRRNERMTRGDATSSRGDETTRRGRIKRMSRGDATTSRCNGMMRGRRRDERQHDNRPV